MHIPFDTLPLERGRTGTRRSGTGTVSQYALDRFQTTLHHVVDCAPRDILDVGVFPPLVFEAMVMNALPNVKMSGV